MKNFRDLQVATKLIIFFIAIMVTLTLGIGYFVIRISAQNLISQIKGRYIGETKDDLTAIDIVMDKNYHLIRDFAQEEILIKETSTLTEITAFLKKKKEEYGYSCMSYYDMQRIKIADTDGEGLGKQEDAAGFWEDVLNDKVSAGSDVRMCEASNVPEVFLPHQ